MTVRLIKYDADALDLLVMTKQTRLSFSGADLDTVRAWPMEKKLAELNYMLGTIESSWEFTDYVFAITDVSRAFTHQFVRTREGSYAQQSQRTVDMSGFEFLTPAKIRGADDPGTVIERTHDDKQEYWDEAHERYVYGMNDSARAYEDLIKLGVPPQDARGVLPTNVSTAIIGKFNLRTLSHMAALRLCTRTQGEYQEIFRAMRAAVIEVHPWAEPFLRVHCARHGVCAFPHYTECPIKGPIFNPDTARRWDGAQRHSLASGTIPTPPATRAEIQEAWVQIRYEAKPKETPRV